MRESVRTNDELYSAVADEKSVANPHAKEVLLYRQALWHGFSSLKKKPLATNLFIEIAEIIKEKNIGIRKIRRNWFIAQRQKRSRTVLY